MQALPLWSALFPIAESRPGCASAALHIHLMLHKDDRSMKHQTSGGQARLTSSRRKLLSLAAGGALAASVPGCASPDRGPAVPSGQAQRATVLGIPNERFYPASGSGALEQEFIESFTRLAATKGLKSPLDLPKLEALAISGGGENGAFGAGLLNGWTEQGTRPEFEIVTGISTGALSGRRCQRGGRPQPPTWYRHQPHVTQPGTFAFVRDVRAPPAKAHERTHLGCH